MADKKLKDILQLSDDQINSLSYSRKKELGFIEEPPTQKRSSGFSRKLNPPFTPRQLSTSLQLGKLECERRMPAYDLQTFLLLREFLRDSERDTMDYVNGKVAQSLKDDCSSIFNSSLFNGSLNIRFSFNDLDMDIVTQAKGENVDKIKDEFEALADFATQKLDETNFTSAARKHFRQMRVRGDSVMVGGPRAGGMYHFDVVDMRDAVIGNWLQVQEGDKTLIRTRGRPIFFKVKATIQDLKDEFGEKNVNTDAASGFQQGQDVSQDEDSSSLELWKGYITLEATRSKKRKGVKQPVSYYTWIVVFKDGDMSDDPNDLIVAINQPKEMVLHGQFESKHNSVYGIGEADEFLPAAGELQELTKNIMHGIGMNANVSFAAELGAIPERYLSNWESRLIEYKQGHAPPNRLDTRVDVNGQMTERLNYEKEVVQKGVRAFDYTERPANITAHEVRLHQKNANAKMANYIAVVHNKIFRPFVKDWVRILQDTEGMPTHVGEKQGILFDLGDKSGIRIDYVSETTIANYHLELDNYDLFMQQMIRLLQSGFTREEIEQYVSFGELIAYMASDKGYDLPRDVIIDDSERAAMQARAQKEAAEEEAKLDELQQQIINSNGGRGPGAVSQPSPLRLI